MKYYSYVIPHSHPSPYLPSLLPSFTPSLLPSTLVLVKLCSWCPVIHWSSTKDRWYIRNVAFGGSIFIYTVCRWLLICGCIYALFVAVHVIASGTNSSMTVAQMHCRVHQTYFDIPEFTVNSLTAFWFFVTLITLFFLLFHPLYRPWVWKYHLLTRPAVYAWPL